MPLFHLSLDLGSALLPFLVSLSTLLSKLPGGGFLGLSPTPSVLDMLDSIRVNISYLDLACIYTLLVLHASVTSHFSILPAWVTLVILAN